MPNGEVSAPGPGEAAGAPPVTPEAEKERARELERQRVIEEKKEAAKKEKEKKEKPAEEEMGVREKINLAGQMATGRLLNVCWSALCCGDILFSPWYLNFHFLMAHAIRSDLFCKFGQEWQFTGKMGAGTGSAAIMWVEIIALFVVDLLMVAIIFILLALFSIIALPFVSKIEALKLLGWTLYNLITTALGL